MSERDPEDWDPLLSAATVIAFCALSVALYIVWHYWVRAS